MQQEAKPFRRAVNGHDLGPLGDPERWGDSQFLDLTVKPTGELGTIEVMSRDLVRAQCPDLIARQWLVLATFRAVLGVSVSLVSIDALVTWGVGQASARSEAVIAPPPVNAPNAWSLSSDDIAVQLPPIPAAFLTLRFRVRLRNNGINPEIAKVSLSAAAAPRAI